MLPAGSGHAWIPRPRPTYHLADRAFCALRPVAIGPLVPSWEGRLPRFRDEVKGTMFNSASRAGVESLGGLNSPMPGSLVSARMGLGISILCRLTVVRSDETLVTLSHCQFNLSNRSANAQTMPEPARALPRNTRNTRNGRCHSGFLLRSGFSTDAPLNPFLVMSCKDGPSRSHIAF